MRITLLECKRMTGRTVLLGFLAFVLAASFYDCHRNLTRYSVELGMRWKEHLSEARKASRGLYLDGECLKELREDAGRYGCLNRENIMELVRGNCEGKTLEELSDGELERFFRIRAQTIREDLSQDAGKGYTDEEIADFMERAESLSALSMGYAEGWRALGETMGRFVFLLVIVIAALVLPLFGRDPAVRMEELVRSVRYGKRRLDLARVRAAYLTATVLYVCGMAVYVVIVMGPFGFEGADQPIQSNIRTFFSLCDMTYLQQFLRNLFMGYVALTFLVSLALFVTILLKDILAGGAVMAVFLVMLVIFNQIVLYPVTHWFTNFMPVRMTDFWHFYTGNELYRIGGHSISCMDWSTLVSLALAAGLLAAGMALLRFDRK